MIISIQWFNSDGTSDEICLEINADRLNKSRQDDMKTLQIEINNRLSQRTAELDSVSTRDKVYVK